MLTPQTFPEVSYEEYAAARENCVAFPIHSDETHLLGVLKYVSRDNTEEVLGVVLNMESFNAQFNDTKRLTLLKYSINYLLQGQLEYTQFFFP